MTNEVITVDTMKWIRRHLNPGKQLGPVYLERFTRKNLAKMFKHLGFKTGAEIGVAGGKFSQVMCEMNPGVKLLCVDTWQVYSGNRRGGPQEQHDRNYQLAQERLAQYDATLIPGFSMDIVKDVPLESLDFVYIDANHAFDYVMMDIIEWAKRVRKGGIVSGHDLYKFRDAGVVEAVNAYVDAHNIKEWFITSERKEKSWFWVKK